MEILFVILFAYLRKIRSDKLQKAAEAATHKARDKAREARLVDQAKHALPTLMK